MATKRYYLCPVIGTGQTTADPIRAKVADYGVNHSAVIPTDPNTGQPLFAWCLVVVSANNHAPLLADAAMDATPDFSLDGKWAAIGQVQRTAIKARLLNRYGFTLTELGGLDNLDAYREVIRAIGRKLDVAFDENNFDVGG